MSPKKKKLNLGALSYAPGLTLETARKMLEAGVKEAERLGIPMVIAIADAVGTSASLLSYGQCCAIQYSDCYR